MKTYCQPCSLFIVHCCVGWCGIDTEFLPSTLWAKSLAFRPPESHCISRGKIEVLTCRSFIVFVGCVCIPWMQYHIVCL